jgi:hypothetical protein
VTLSARTLLVLAAAASCGCGGKTIDPFTEPDGAVITGSDPSLFVGTWACSGKDTFTGNSVGSGYSSPYTSLVTFTANPDWTLAFTLELLTVQSDPLPDAGLGCASYYTFTASGGMAIAISGPTCSSDAYGNAANAFTGVFKDGTFTLSPGGRVATMTLDTTVIPGPGSEIASGISSNTGSCTRQPEPEAGAN